MLPNFGISHLSLSTTTSTHHLVRLVVPLRINGNERVPLVEMEIGQQRVAPKLAPKGSMRAPHGHGPVQVVLAGAQEAAQLVVVGGRDGEAGGFDAVSEFGEQF